MRHGARLVGLGAAVLLVGCGGGSKPNHPGAVTQPPSATSTTGLSAPTLSLDALSQASFDISCDEVTIAQAADRMHSAQGDAALSQAADGFAKIADPTVQTYASAIRAAAALPASSRTTVLAKTVTFCEANGYKPSS